MQGSDHFRPVPQRFALRLSNLSGANLMGATISGAFALEMSNLQGVNLQGATISGFLAAGGPNRDQTSNVSGAISAMQR